MNNFNIHIVHCGQGLKREHPGGGGELYGEWSAVPLITPGLAQVVVVGSNTTGLTPFRNRESRSSRSSLKTTSGTQDSRLSPLLPNPDCHVSGDFTISPQGGNSNGKILPDLKTILPK